MNALQRIAAMAEARGMACVVIGGFAVIEHGYPRLTADLDLLVPRPAQEEWRSLLAQLGYRMIVATDNFQQYAAPDSREWPVDLMLVNSSTFEGIAAQAISRVIHGVPMRLVSLPHLLALKLHVLKQAKLHRFLKDFEDVIQLVRRNQIDLRNAEIRGLFLKYGNADLYEKIRRASESD